MKKILSLLAGIFLTALVNAQNYHICLGSFSKFENASDYARNLTLKGYTTAIEPSVINEKLYYRILLAQNFDKLNTAKVYKMELQKELGKNDFWVLNVDLAKKNLPEKIVLQAKQEFEKVDSKTDVIEKPATIVKSETKQEKPIKLEVREITEKIQTPIEEPIVFEIDFSLAKIAKNDDLTVKIDEQTFMQPLSAASISEINPNNIEGNVKSSTKNTFIEEFDEIAVNEKTFNNSTFPTTIPQSVQKLIKTFPMNRNFSLEKIALYDLDNIRDSGLDIDINDLIKTKLPFEFSVMNENLHAASFGKYIDNDFDTSLSVLMFSGENFADFDNFETLSGEETFDIDFKIADENFNCKMVKISREGEIYNFFGRNQSNSIFLAVQAEDFNKTWINRFVVGQISENGNILKNKFVKNSLLSLPNENSKLDRRFQKFNLEKSENTVKRELGFENREHWNACAEFDQEDTVMKMNFFDID